MLSSVADWNPIPQVDEDRSRKSRLSDEQIIGFLREAEAGMPIETPRRRKGSSDIWHSRWRSTFVEMNEPDSAPAFSHGSAARQALPDRSRLLVARRDASRASNSHRARSSSR